MLTSLSPELGEFNCVLGEDGWVVKIVLDAMLAETIGEVPTTCQCVQCQTLPRLLPRSSKDGYLDLEVPSGRLGQQP